MDLYILQEVVLEVLKMILLDIHQELEDLEVVLILLPHQHQAMDKMGLQIQEVVLVELHI